MSFFFFSSRRRHTRCSRDWSSDVCSSDLSASLHKISEMYDRIAFSGAGKYNEFEMLRKAGIRHADLKGYTYSREDVTAKSLANAYSQSIGSLFSADPKPLEVELLVVEVGQDGKPNELYRISFDGSIIDERGVAGVGGGARGLATIPGKQSGRPRPPPRGWAEMKPL